MSEDYNTKKIVVRGFLQNQSLQYRNEEAGYVSDKIFPVITGLNKEAKIYKHARADQFRAEAKTRAPGAPAAVGETRAEAVNLNPQNWAIARKIPDELRQQSRAQGNFPLKPDSDAAKWIADQIWIRRELEMSSILHSTVWSGVGAGGEDADGRWGDPDPALDTMVADIKSKTDVMILATGKRPNRLFLTQSAWSTICQGPFWLDKLNNTQFSASIRTQQIEQTLNLKIDIGWAVHNTDVESTDTDAHTGAFIMGPSGAGNQKGTAFLYYAPETPGIDTLSVGYQYRLIKDGVSDVKMTKWREEAMHSDMIDGEMEFDFAPMITELGFLWKDTATT